MQSSGTKLITDLIKTVSSRKHGIKSTVELTADIVVKLYEQGNYKLLIKYLELLHTSQIKILELLIKHKPAQALEGDVVDTKNLTQRILSKISKLEQLE